MRRPTLYLRIASVLTLIMAVLHTIGGVFGKPLPGAATVAWTAMESNHFLAFGVDRSYKIYYIGFGLSMSISMVVEGVVFWLLGNLARTDAARLRPILMVFLGGYLFTALNAYLFFFFPPVITTLLISACLAGAWFTAKPSPAN